ncbi:hypothetical protein LSH36_435g04014 [Paralvinella palmiformis]|uniref:Transmembrane protein n=1 Tax=Paralvinella palmiformis TaxID=53620 RepID=A0AAD9JBM6_9ANNE|nr:hypothetical protein LSH36_435g04014 [Paralvinella palmiformis]
MYAHKKRITIAWIICISFSEEAPTVSDCDKCDASYIPCNLSSAEAVVEECIGVNVDEVAVKRMMIISMSTKRSILFCTVSYLTCFNVVLFVVVCPLVVWSRR